jgi:hypothetical protein
VEVGVIVLFKLNRVNVLGVDSIFIKLNVLKNKADGVFILRCYFRYYWLLLPWDFNLNLLGYEVRDVSQFSAGCNGTLITALF